MGRGFGFRTYGEGAVVYAKWPGIEYGIVAEGIRGTCNWHNQVADNSAQVLSKKCIAIKEGTSSPNCSPTSVDSWAFGR